MLSFEYVFDYAHGPILTQQFSFLEVVLGAGLIFEDKHHQFSWYIKTYTVSEDCNEQTGGKAGTNSK